MQSDTLRIGFMLALLFGVTVWAQPLALNCSAPSTFGGFPSGTASFPAVASDAAGNATAIWEWNSSNTMFEIHSVRYSTVTNLWTNIFVLNNTPDVAGPPEVASAMGGQPFAVWYERTSGHYDVVVQPFNGNSAQNLTASLGAQENGAANVTVDTRGNAEAVWMALKNGRYFIQASHYFATSDSWSIPVTLSDTTQSAYYPQVGVDNAGNAHAVWNRYDGTQQAVQTSVYSIASGSWSNPVTLGQGAAFTEVAVTPAGDAHFLWTDAQGAVQTARYSKDDAAWVGRTMLSQIGSQAQIAASPNGDALAVWVGMQNTIEFARYAAVTRTWSTPSTMVALGGKSLQPAVAIGPLGDAVVVWSQSMTGYVDIYGAYFSSLAAKPVVSAIGLGLAPRVALGKTTATIVWVTTSCSLSAGCPPVGVVQTLRCALPGPLPRRRASR